MERTTPLGPQLVDLLDGHGVRAEMRDDVVWLPDVGQWANLWMTATPEGRFLMDLRATAPEGGMVADQWVAMGTDVASARQDGLTSFCRCGFHVVLAGLWGVLEPDQVDHEVREVGGATWDLYVGPYFGRFTPGLQGLRAPATLVDQVLSAFDTHLTTGHTHALRVFVASVNGATTFEAVVDGEPAEAVGEVVARANWPFPPTGFVSLRWLVLARRQAGGPSHRTRRTCGGT